MSKMTLLFLLLRTLALKKYESKKLWYRKYPYKLVLFSSVAKIFRENNLAGAREVLDNLSYQDQRGHTMTMISWGRQEPISPSSYIDAEMIWDTLLRSESEYRIRVEHPRIILFSTDREWLSSIAEKALDPLEFWEPDSKYLDYIKEGDTELIEKPLPYKFKVYIKDRADPSLADWISKNPDKAHAGDICLQSIRNGHWLSGLYFYVRDEKVLSLTSFMMGKPQRIVKIVSKQDLDK